MDAPVGFASGEGSASGFGSGFSIQGLLFRPWLGLAKLICNGFSPREAEVWLGRCVVSPHLHPALSVIFLGPPPRSLSATRVAKHRCFHSVVCRLHTCSWKLSPGEGVKLSRGQRLGSTACHIRRKTWLCRSWCQNGVTPGMASVLGLLWSWCPTPLSSTCPSCSVCLHRPLRDAFARPSPRRFTVHRGATIPGLGAQGSDPEEKLDGSEIGPSGVVFFASIACRRSCRWLKSVAQAAFRLKAACRPTPVVRIDSLGPVVS